MDFYSVTLSIICTVDDGQIPEDGYLQDIQVHIVRASDFESALEQAIAIGRSREHEYINSDGDMVYWKLKEVEYVRRLGPEVTGVEVATRLEVFRTDEMYRGDHDFRPEGSEPIMDDESDSTYDPV